MNFLIIILGASVAAYVAYALANLVHKRTVTNPLSGFLASDTPQAVPWNDRAGQAIARQLPISLEIWEDHLTWAQRGEKYKGYSVGSLVFLASILSALALILPFNYPSLMTWMAPTLIWAIPFIWVRSAANKVRHRVVRSLPELAALVAAEISANTPPEEALERAAALPGPLSKMVAEAANAAQKYGRPLLSHDHQKGVLREVFEHSGVPTLRAFAVQLDMAAAKGVEVAERMVEISRTLASEYRQQLLENIEKLETSLTTAVAFFYFAPMVLLILLPLFGEILDAI
jgi:Flp pilus assembly protein TadB